MKTITLDYETYEKEISSSESFGARHSLKKILQALREGGDVAEHFHASEDSGWREVEIKKIAKEIEDLFKAQKEKN